MRAGIPSEKTLLATQTVVALATQPDVCSLSLSIEIGPTQAFGINLEEAKLGSLVNRAMFSHVQLVTCPKETTTQINLSYFAGQVGRPSM